MDEMSDADASRQAARIAVAAIRAAAGVQLDELYADAAARIGGAALDAFGSPQAFGPPRFDGHGRVAASLLALAAAIEAGRVL